jgi:predicted RecA/RadA family phage recombinase
MNNFVGPGNIIPFTVAGVAAVSGAAVKKGDLLYIPQTAGAVGAVIPGAIEGVFDVAKVSAQAWTEGQQINWDDTAKLFTSVTTGNFRAGTAVRVEANPTATGRVRLAGVNLGAALA